MYMALDEWPPDEATNRMDAHTNPGSVTLLFKTFPGLEVDPQTDERFHVPYLNDHVLVNLGLALSCISF